MERLTMAAHFRGEAAQPSGEPPQTQPRAESVALEAISADGSPVDLDRAFYANDVTFTSESTFVETGTISFGDGELDIETVGEGTLAPSASAELLQGAVIWRVTGGRGRFEGASGLITSNFLLRPGTGEVEDHENAVVFLP
jgi:hypothetical protein